MVRIAEGVLLYLYCTITSLCCGSIRDTPLSFETVPFPSARYHEVSCHPLLAPIGHSYSTLHSYSNSCPPRILTWLCVRRRSLVFVPLGFACEGRRRLSRRWPCYASSRKWTLKGDCPILFCACLWINVFCLLVILLYCPVLSKSYGDEWIKALFNHYPATTKTSDKQLCITCLTLFARSSTASPKLLPFSAIIVLLIIIHEILSV